MEIKVNRRGGLTLRDQIVAQVELRILTGELAEGRRLPGIRPLARRLGIHHRTVYAAYRRLQLRGNLEFRRGAGAFVRRGRRTAATGAGGFEDSLRHAVLEARRAGVSLTDIRAAVAAWLVAPSSSKVVIVDPQPETAQIIAAELEPVLGVAPRTATVAEVARDPAALAGTLVVALPFHAEHVRGLAPRARVVDADIDVSAGATRLVRGLPPGALLLVVSHSPGVLDYARAYLESARGDDALLMCRELGDAAGWSQLTDSADLVLADSVSAAPVQRRAPRAHVFRLLAPGAVAAIGIELSVPLVVPAALPASA